VTPGVTARCSTSERPRPDTAPVPIPCTGHAGPIAERRGRCAAGPTMSVACLKIGRRPGGRRERRRWESNPLQPGCSRSPGRPAPASSRCPRQESNLALDLRRVVCAPPHPEDLHDPARESEPSLRLRRPPYIRHTRRDCPRQESNLVCDLRRVACRPSHSEGEDGSRGARSRTLSIRVGAGVLSREDAPVGGPGRAGRGSEARTPAIPPPGDHIVAPTGVDPASPIRGVVSLQGDDRDGIAQCVGTESNRQVRRNVVYSHAGPPMPSRRKTISGSTSGLRARRPARDKLGCCAVLPTGPSPPPAPSMGFEPTISTVTRWRALWAAPRGHVNSMIRGDSNPHSPASKTEGPG